MEWLAANWFWVFIGILFVSMHLFGHGGHGGHGSRGGGGCGHGGNDAADKPGTDTADSDTSPGHRH